MISFQQNQERLQPVGIRCNIRRLLWANDFPHSDSTWPWSQELLKKHTANLTEEEKNLILHDNTAELYNLAI